MNWLNKVLRALRLPVLIGDGGPATKAALLWPAGLALDTEGSIYIADSGHHRVRRVDLAGIITTFAGDGRLAYSGDGGPATKASLCCPTGIALGPDGSLFIADSWNNRIRMVDPAGTITTVAGDGWEDHDGAGRYGGDGGPATDASLDQPGSVAVGADGTLYIADDDNYRIRKVDSTGIITTFAGDGVMDYTGDGGPATEASLSCVCGVTVANDGGLYVPDPRECRIRKIDTDGIINSVAGDGWTDRLGKRRHAGDGGPATQASLNNPTTVAVAPDGSLYIAGGNRIRKVDPNGVINTIAGRG